MTLDEHEIRIRVDDRVEGTGEIVGDLRLPETPGGVVVFAHGSGSSRQSPRNRMVADDLHRAGFATLLFDLLTPAEERVDLVTRHLRFDIPLLAGRLAEAVDHVGRRADTRGLPIGVFGASTGAAAAIIAAAARPEAVGAVVSRGGRPDLADDALGAVLAPTLLIVGGLDDVVIGLNRDAAARMTCPHELTIVPGATHLFEEAGSLEEVARLATAWFRRHLRVAETS
ncbi:MAG TPA: dienelactone hydrolase family protein [Actinomycetota bacterium]